MPVDVCDIVSGVIDAILNTTGSNIACKLTIEAEVRVIGKLPYKNVFGSDRSSRCLYLCGTSVQETPIFIFLAQRAIRLCRTVGA